MERLLEVWPWPDALREGKSEILKYNTSVLIKRKLLSGDEGYRPRAWRMIRAG
jgi:hypothetical protein